jgi:hypothetical protein
MMVDDDGDGWYLVCDNGQVGVGPFVSSDMLLIMVWYAESTNYPNDF